MKGRILANSESLKKHFPQVYQELFSKCPVVTSSPGAFWWTGAYSVLEGNLGILQKLPLRVYVGLENTKPKEVNIASFQYYDPYYCKFLSSPFEEPASSKLLTFLQELQEIQKLCGLKIHFLLEVPPGRGLNASSALCNALSLAFHIMYKRIELNSIENLKDLSSGEIIKDKSFNTVFRLAWKLDHIFHGSSSGAGAFASAITSEYPIVYFPEKIKLSSQLFKNSWLARFRHVDDLNYYGARLNEILDLPPSPNWPIDFGMIFTGVTDVTILSIESTFERRETLWQMKKELLKLMKSSSLRQLMRSNPYFRGDKYKLWRAYIDPMQTNAFEALFAIKEVFEKGLSERALMLFFDFIGRNHDLLQMLGFSNPTTHKICQEVKDYLTINNPKMAATSITGGSQKGDIIFATTYNVAHDKIFEIIKKLREKFSANISLDYASWLDGFEDEGIRLEQHLDEKIYSDFISEGSIKLTHFSKSGFSHSDIYTLEEFQRKRKTIDALIDTVENEIWIQNHRLDSKKIPSTTATIKILRVLLKKLGRQVKNRYLPQSSYIQDRNELQSKIISPLNREIKKRLKKELPLKIHGSLDDFTVQLSRPPFDIYLIEKVF